MSPVVSYQSFRSGFRKAVGDYTDLIRGLDQAIKTRSTSTARQTAADFFNRPTGQITAVAAPLVGTAAAIGMIDAQQGDIEPAAGFLGMHAGVPYAAGSAVAATMAAPHVGRLMDRDRFRLAEQEARTLRQDLETLDAAIAADDALYAKGGGSQEQRAATNAKRQRAERIRGTQLKDSEEDLRKLMNRARTRGGALTAAGLALAGLTGAYLNNGGRGEQAVVAVDPYLSPFGWSAISSTDRMKDWAAGRADEDMEYFPYY